MSLNKLTSRVREYGDLVFQAPVSWHTVVGDAIIGINATHVFITSGGLIGSRTTKPINQVTVVPVGDTIRELWFSDPLWRLNDTLGSQQVDFQSAFDAEAFDAALKTAKLVRNDQRKATAPNAPTAQYAADGRRVMADSDVSRAIGKHVKPSEPVVDEPMSSPDGRWILHAGEWLAVPQPESHTHRTSGVSRSMNRARTPRELFSYAVAFALVIFLIVAGVVAHELSSAHTRDEHNAYCVTFGHDDPSCPTSSGMSPGAGDILPYGRRDGESGTEA